MHNETTSRSLEIALSVLSSFKESGGIYNDYKDDDFGKGFTDGEYDQMLNDLKHLKNSEDLDLVKCSTCGGLFHDDNIYWEDKEGDKTRPYCVGCNEINEKFTEYRDRPYSDDFNADCQVTSEEEIAAMLFDSECGISETLAQHLSQQVLYSVLSDYRPDLIKPAHFQIVWVFGGSDPELKYLLPTETREESIALATHAWLEGEYDPHDNMFLLTNNDKIDVSISMLDYHILWNVLGDVPVNDEEIEESFLHFDAGTHRETIWYWFEETFDIAISSLMYKKEGE